MSNATYHVTYDMSYSGNLARKGLNLKQELALFTGRSFEKEGRVGIGAKKAPVATSQASTFCTSGTMSLDQASSNNSPKRDQRSLAHGMLALACFQPHALLSQSFVCEPDLNLLQHLGSCPFSSANYHTQFDSGGNKTKRVSTRNSDFQVSQLIRLLLPSG